MDTNKDFRKLVYEYVALIPAGRVMTYGQLAALAGSPRAARMVGQIAHWGPEELPWHRVVNRHGGLAGAFTYGGREGQAERLRREGVEVDQDYKLNISTLLWIPQQ